MHPMLLSAALALLAAPANAQRHPADILMVRSPDSSIGNWGALPAMLGLSARIESREDSTLPEGDLSRYKLVILSTNMDVYEDERRRLWEYANRGGILVTWFADDTRAHRSFWPYKLVLSDKDPPKATFADTDHPLLKGLRGKTFQGRLVGGDVVKSWNHRRWQVLAQTDHGAALLVARYGEGAIVDWQFHAPFSSRQDVLEVFAENLMTWAGVARVDPEELKQRSLREVLAAVARRQMRPLQSGEWTRGEWEHVQASKPAAGIAWSYPRGVTLYGMLRAGKVLGDEAFSDFVLRQNDIVAKQHAWLSWQRETFGKHTTPSLIPQLMRLGCLDDCGSMASQVVEGLLNHGAEATPEMLAMLRSIADYITNKQSRFPDGSLCRGRTLWIDDLYMSVPFLARWGVYTEDSSYLDDAARQIINFASRMQDDDGLWFHGWFNREGKPSPYKWGRGNGWSLLSQVELLSHLPDDHPERERLLGILRKHIAGLMRVQAESGMWRQVLDEPDLWEETSCTGMFAYSIARAVRRGWIEPENLPAARRAVEALKTRVSWDGSVLGTCAGTGISRSLDAYRNRPRPVNDGHGPGPVLLAGTELLVARRK